MTSQLLESTRMQTQPYDRIAPEYYDAARHPTCAAFRKASIALIRGFLTTSQQEVLEVGCGRSIFCDITSGIERLTLIDSSEFMMQHTSGISILSAIHANAEEMPVAASSVDCLISSLGDPYNTVLFWKEVARVVRPGGKILFTTPSYEWAVKYRLLEGSQKEIALFLTRDGEKVETPSFVHPREEQIILMEHFGLALQSVQDIARSEIDANAPKLAVLPDAAPIVSLFAATKG